MKEFDLEKALAGEPVVLRNGDKAFVKFVLENPLFEDDQVVGFHIDSEGKEEVTSWGNNGVHIPNTNSIYDIIGMWEEPRPTVTLTLPAPIKTAHHNQEVFKRGNSTIIRFYFDANRDKHRKMLESGSLFYSEEDAQAWLDAMRDTRR
ncbi:pyruvate kinase [Pasteurella multocida]|uniref:pyruvate kinase n=3 Tax=Pasteurella multocida TaxID=747 RepID=UPI001CE06CB9|nr:pyruvate kinase [Pasteurella multocida]UBU76022.1 pyruvate kinase [Pasteurella multocida]UZT12841.1 pyruvate kinase [Pasteurella multocida]UZT15396.1 pyruvate kinase [Pasteurella multocida]UZU31448.1 pyruvate kinase [Pasteurella multocida]UZU36106.1 pyruvate kinase [Pasteurella multocida]